MNRVCLLKSTGKLIEMQSGGYSEDLEEREKNLDTLRQNALKAGYKINEISVLWMTDEEFAEALSKEPSIIIEKEEEKKKKIKNLAQLALDKSDITILRCYEKEIVVPQSWLTYRAELRIIVANPTPESIIPDRPPYPDGV